jgi:penicillin-binding protein 1A
MRVVVRYARHAMLAALFIVAALLGTASGVLFAYSDDLPLISQLDDYTPSTITRVIGKDGALVGEFASERRVVLAYGEIPVIMRQAVLAAEDSGFFNHFGISPTGVARTIWNNFRKFDAKAGGASTLTQQLTRKLFLTDEKSWERKVKEALLTLQIEKRFTKEEILTIYCNQMYFGHGAYGVEAAARLYFGKSVKDVTAEEAALIAGILQGNARQSPYNNMDAALRRRNYTLGRMAEEGFITREAAEAARQRPIVVAGDPNAESSVAPYFLEEVRKYLEAKYGAEALYKSGLTVRTPLDLQLQAAANRAIERGLRRIDKRRGVFRKPARNVLAEKHTLEGFRHARWSRPMREGDVVPAVVMAVESGGVATVRMGRLTGQLTKASVQWTRRASAADLVKPGDLIEVGLTKVDETAGTAVVTIDQPPILEGAMIALDNDTGQVLAMVGGFSFARSKFNRATQAHRQMGSTFKPILYTAAIDRGLTPTTILVDEPSSFVAGPNQPLYTPGNYDRKFMGTMTLRHALELSRNIPAVKVMDMLGPSQVVGYAKRFGFPEEFQPYLSAALGAQEATLSEVTSAYTAFPNRGIRMAPLPVLSIADREGSGLEENRPQPRDAIRADTAFVMTNLLRGVVLHGTGAAARELDWPVAGKTGTVDDYTDAWFVGFDPDITVGVWLGYDEKKPIGPSETGTTAALPIWIEFMRDYLNLYANRESPPSFEPPGNIVFMNVDRSSGEPATDGSPNTVSEAFISGTQPIRQ